MTTYYVANMYYVYQVLTAVAEFILTAISWCQYNYCPDFTNEGKGEITYLHYYN